ncbi:MAG: glycosyltransferase family 39 protein [Planctomycetaceae bacterium]|nr:glycosyltransferase family 39 protein [Planctomycetaceae bacterium]
MERGWVAAIALLVLVVACYGRIVKTFFVQDDFLMLAVAQWPMPNEAMYRGIFFFRPLSTYWLTVLNVAICGMQPVGHHVIHLAMFLATIAILFAWLRDSSGSVIGALFGTVLYAFSKTHLYTLGWIAGGIDVSAALFFVLCLWMTGRYLRASDARARVCPWLCLGIGLSFACGLLCKESCVVFAPAYLAWIAVRRYSSRRPFQRAEIALAVVLLAVLAVYLPCWRVASCVIGSPAARLQIKPSRSEKVLCDSVIAVLPAGESSLPRRTLWLVIPCAMVGIIWALRRRATRVREHLAMALAIWASSAVIYAFTEYPWWLQLYYSHFSVIGLTLLAAMTVCGLEAWVADHRNCRRAAVGVAAVFFGVWIVLGFHTIRDGIRLRRSPALCDAELSRAAYEQLAPYLKAGQYKQVVFLGVSDIVWSSMHGGDMLSAFYPGLRADFDGRDNFKAGPNERTNGTTLVTRQTGERSFTIIR